MADKSGGRTKRPTFTDQEALLFHSQGRRKARSRGYQADGDAARPLARLFARRRRPGARHRRRTKAGLRLHHQGQFRRRHHQRHRHSRPRQSRRAGGQAGDGRQGGPVQALCRHRFHRSRGSTEDPDEFINCVKLLGKSWGGINLEDIKAPECFIIEQRLRELLDIPVFHDDQHGTAIIAAAGLINALELTGREIKTTKSCATAPAPPASPVSSFARDRLPAGEPDPVRHQGGDLRGPHRGHEPVEIGLCGQDRRTHARRRHGRRRRVLRPLGQGRGEPDMVKAMAEKPIIFAMANPDPEITRRSRRGPQRRHHGDRPLGLSEPDQQRARLPLHLPRRARRARAHHQHGDEDRRGARARRIGARGRARRRRRRLRRAAEIRARLHHPGAVRPASHRCDPAGGGAGRDGHQSRPAADRRHGGLSAAIAHAARSGRRRAAAGFRAAAPAAAPRRVRRGRGGAGDPRRRDLRASGARHRDTGRPRGRACAKPPRRLGVELGNGIEIINARAVVAQRRLCGAISTSGCSATATCNATVSAWSTRTATISPPAWWRSATPTPWSPASPAISPSRSRTCGAASIPNPATASSACRWCWRAAAPCWSPTPPSPRCRTPQDIAEIAIEAARVARSLGYEPRLALLAFSTFGHPPGERSAAGAGGGADPRPAAGRFRV